MIIKIINTEVILSLISIEVVIITELDKPKIKEEQVMIEEVIEKVRKDKIIDNMMIKNNIISMTEEVITLQIILIIIKAIIRNKVIRDMYKNQEHTINMKTQEINLTKEIQQIVIDNTISKQLIEIMIQILVEVL